MLTLKDYTPDQLDSTLQQLQCLINGWRNTAKRIGEDSAAHLLLAAEQMEEALVPRTSQERLQSDIDFFANYKAGCHEQHKHPLPQDR